MRRFKEHMVSIWQPVVLILDSVQGDNYPSMQLHSLPILTMSGVCGSNKPKLAFHMDVGHRLSSWSCTDRSPWQYIKVHFVWRPGYTFLEHTFSHLHAHTGAHTVWSKHTQASPNSHTHMQRHTMHTDILSDKALSLDAQAHFAAMDLSRPPCCHAAVARSTHYLVSCDSISESFGPGSWTKMGKNSQPPLNSDDRESEQ